MYCRCFSLSLHTLPFLSFHIWLDWSQHSGGKKKKSLTTTHKWHTKKQWVQHRPLLLWADSVSSDLHLLCNYANLCTQAERCNTVQGCTVHSPSSLPPGDDWNVRVVSEESHIACSAHMVAHSQTPFCLPWIGISFSTNGVDLFSALTLRLFLRWRVGGTFSCCFISRSLCSCFLPSAVMKVTNHRIEHFLFFCLHFCTSCCTLLVITSSFWPSQSGQCQLCGK